MLKVLLDNLDGLGDELKPLYIEKDGKFHLDVEVVEDPKAKATIKEFRDKNVTLMKEVEGFKSTIAVWDEIGSQDTFKEALKTLEAVKDEKLFDEGKIEEILNKRTGAMKRDHEAKVRNLTERAETAEKDYKKSKTAHASASIDNQIQIAISKIDAKIRKGAVEDVVARGRAKFTMDEEGKVVAQDIHGNPLYGKDGVTPLTIIEWITELPNEAVHFFEDSSGGGGGGGDKNVTMQLSPEQLAKIPPSERLKMVHRGQVK